MAKSAEYSIVINGISESISAVDALNKQLDALEKRIKTLESSKVNVSASSGGAMLVHCRRKLQSRRK